MVFPQFESIYEKIYQAADLNGLAALLTEIRDQYGLAHLVYHAIHLPSTADPNPILLLTYDSEWVRRYTERDYFRIDPSSAMAEAASFRLIGPKSTTKALRLVAFSRKPINLALAETE